MENELDEIDQIFPYPLNKRGGLPIYRKDQKEAIEFISEAIKNKEHCIMEAFCGFGKTITTLTACVKENKKVIILTPNYPCKNNWAKEALILNKESTSNLIICDLRSIPITCAKKLVSADDCTYERKKNKECELYNNAFIKDKNVSNPSIKTRNLLDKIKDKCLYADFLNAGYKWESSSKSYWEETKKECEKENLCTYYVLRQLLPKADVIILDYFWVFLLFDKLKNTIPDLENYVLLIDECDVLVDRLMDTFMSFELTVSGLKRIEKQAMNCGLEKEVKINKEVMSVLDAYCSSIEENELIDKEEIINTLILPNKTFYDLTHFYEKLEKDITSGDEYESVSVKPSKFFNRLIEVDANKNYIGKQDKKEGIGLKIKPYELKDNLKINGENINEVFQYFNNVVLFSATIGNPSIFCLELGIDEINNVKQINCLHNKDIRCLIDWSITSKRRVRSIHCKNYVHRLTRLIKITPQILVSTASIDDKDIGSEALIQKLRTDGVEAKENNVFKDGVEGITLIGSHTSEARCVNHYGTYNTVFLLGYPEKYYNHYQRCRTEYIERIYKDKAGKFLKGGGIRTTVQVIGRITRNLTRDKKLIILSDNRFRTDPDIYDGLPGYIRDRVEYVKSEDELIKKAYEVVSSWK